MDKGSFTANEDITLTISDGSGRMQSVDYRRSSSTHQWALCEMTFSIKGTASRTLSFLFTAGRRNIRIDDIRLETSDGQPDCEISFEGTSENIWPWAELPETVTENPDYRYITHYATTVRSNQKVRNFVSCYDTSRHNPIRTSSTKVAAVPGRKLRRSSSIHCVTTSKSNIYYNSFSAKFSILNYLFLSYRSRSGTT